MPFLVWLTLAVLLVSQFFRTPSKKPPLFVEDGLWAPWAGQASTVFSLTALFNAYLAILFTAGIASLLGLLLGTVSGLVLIKMFVGKSNTTFHRFLATRAVGSSTFHTAFCWLIVACQAGFALSELVILKEIVRVDFSLSPAHAMIFAVSIALIVYFYCLVRGYEGVFETDFYQFVFIITMIVSILGISLLRFMSGVPIQVDLAVGKSDIWTFDLSLLQSHPFIVRPVVGFLTGIAFIVASPDAWKRVFVVCKRPKSSFTFLVLAGIVPFVAIIPFSLLFTKSSQITPFLPALLGLEDMGWYLETALMLGLVASFMSSFDSALISSVHVATVVPHLSLQLSRSRHFSLYRLRVGLLFLAVVTAAFVFTSLTSNPYSIALCLMGPYAVVGGIVIGTFGLNRKGAVGLEWLVLAGLLLWYSYVLSEDLIFTNNARKQMEAVLPAAGLFLVVSIASFLLTLTRFRDDKSTD